MAANVRYTVLTSKQLPRVWWCVPRVRSPVVHRHVSCHGNYTNCLLRPQQQQRWETWCRVKAGRVISSPFASAAGPLKCWKCGATLARNVIICNKCDALQAPDEKVNYFELFEIREEFDLDPVKLTAKHKQLQWKLHPDKFSLKDKKEQDFSEMHSSIVNAAHRTLSQPLNRAKYLLEIKGHPYSGDDVKMDQEFLADVMNLNEKLADFDTEDDIKQFAKDNNQKMDEIHKRLSSAFRSNDLESVKSDLSKLKYYCNIEDKIKEALVTIIANK